MNERMRNLSEQASKWVCENEPSALDDTDLFYELMQAKFAELILANADELKRMMNTDPINKPFELNPKFVAKCDEIGRSRRQFQ